MKEIRAYWLNDWFGKTIPEIKKVLVETTNLPEDVIGMLPEYFAYPYGALHYCFERLVHSD